jgi:hypothetical protein
LQATPLHTQHQPSTLTLQAKNQAHPARLAAVSGDADKFPRRCDSDAEGLIHQVGRTLQHSHQGQRQPQKQQQQQQQQGKKTLEGA